MCRVSVAPLTRCHDHSPALLRAPGVRRGGVGAGRAGVGGGDAGVVDAARGARRDVGLGHRAGRAGGTAPDAAAGPGRASRRRSGGGCHVRGELARTPDPHHPTRPSTEPPGSSTALETHPDVDAALATTELTVDQARVIVDAVDDLPTDLTDPDTIAKAEAFLLAEAQHHDARALRVLGRRLLEVLDPAAADAEEARRLQAEEADARAAASFTMADDGHGTCHGRFTIPSLHGSILRKHLLALAAPKRNPDAAVGDAVSAPAPAGVLRVPRNPTRVIGPALRGTGRHRRGHHDPRVPPRRPPGRRAVRRQPHLRERSPTAGLLARGSSRSSSAEPPNPSTSAADSASTPKPNGSPWESATAAAPRPGVIGPRR